MKANFKILNLEDNVTDAELNQAMLARRWPECRLTRVGNLRDYRAALEKVDFDIILSDYTIPGMSSNAALTLARERCPEIPFMYVSGTIGEDAAVEALKNGATDYVLKHRPKRLVPAVERAFREVEQRAEQALAEETMRQSEQKYRTLFESLNEGAFLVDVESDKIIDANQSAQSLTGCTRQEILGRRMSEFVSLEASGDRRDFDQNLIRQDGEVLRIRIHLTHMTMYDRRFVLLLCREVTPISTS